jgi:hypothetical protein
MPPEIIAFIIIVVISFIFGGLAIKWSNAHKLEIAKLRAQESDNSLGTGELRDLIQESMLEAMAPLEERLELVERQTRRLPEHSAERQEGASDE